MPGGGRTQSEFDDAQDASNAGDSLRAQQLSIVQAQVACGPLDDEGRGSRRRGRRKGVVRGRRVDIDVAVGEHAGHCDGLSLCRDSGQWTVGGGSGGESCRVVFWDKRLV